MAQQVTERPVTQQLKALRERADLSMAEMAKLTGYKTASGYQRYEDPNLYKAPLLPVPLTRKLAGALVDRGDPPITRSEVYALGGMDAEGRIAEVALEAAVESARRGDRLDRRVLLQEMIEEHLDFLEKQRRRLARAGKPDLTNHEKAIQFIQHYEKTLGL